jgi:DNA repair exonuclease SbcCD ATPase subunit
MIKFKKLTYKNFLGVGDKPIVIDFDCPRTTLVIGKNGQGKSTMLDALSYALFSKPYRNINKIQLVNSVNLKNTVVTIEFSIGTKEYKIVRGLKPNIFEIWVDGKMINQDSNSRNFQSFLESSILKLNHKSFHQIVVIGTSSFVPFMQLSAYDRRKVIEDLLDISIFSKMNQLIKGEQSSTKALSAEHTNRIKRANAEIRLLRENIKKIQAITQMNIAETASDIARLSELRDAVDASLAAIQNNIAASNTSLESQFKKVKKRQSQMEVIEGQLSNKYNACQKSIAYHMKHSSCPTCSAPIPEEKRNAAIESLNAENEELSKALSEIQSHIADDTKSLERMTQELATIHEQNTQIATLNSERASYDRQITALNTKLATADDVTAAAEDEAKLESLYRDVDKLNDELMGYLLDQQYQNTMIEILKDAGVKSQIIKQYLPTMNALINSYLNILDLFVLFELDDTFKESIKSRHRDTFSYYSFSEGEKARINLAILFTWRDIAKRKNSTNTNLLIMDEIFDASLDAVGIDSVLNILDSIDDTVKIFVISHKRELLEDKFERTIMFEKPGNFGTMKVL